MFSWGKLNSSLAVATFQGFHPMPWNQWYCPSLWPWQRTSMSNTSLRLRHDISAPKEKNMYSVVFIIQYSSVFAIRSSEITENWSSQKWTSWTACYSHTYLSLALSQCWQFSFLLNQSYSCSCSTSLLFCIIQHPTVKVTDTSCACVFIFTYTCYNFRLKQPWLDVYFFQPNISFIPRLPLFLSFSLRSV